MLDWFQQTYDDKATRAYMGGWFNGAALGAVVVLPAQAGRRAGGSQNDTLIVYNFQEKWWSIGKLHAYLRRARARSAATRSWPRPTTVYRHERGHLYPDYA